MVLTEQSATSPVTGGPVAGMSGGGSEGEAFSEVAGLLKTNYLRNAGFDDSPREPVILVIGAGASEISHFPRWEKLKEKVLDIGKLDRRDFVTAVWSSLRARGIFPDNDDPERELLDRDDVRIEMIASVACRRRACAQQIRQLLYDHYAAGGLWEEAGPPPLLVYELVAHLVKHGFVDHVITFNFDELLDVALTNELGNGAYLRIFSGFECVSILDQGKPTLIKIHGTVSSPESMRFTDEKSSVFAPGMEAHLRRLIGADRAREDPGTAGRRHVQRVHLLSIGYGWRDLGFYGWLRKHARAGNVASLTILRQHPGLPELFEPRQAFRDMTLRTVSTSALAADGRPLSIESFVWSLVDDVIGRLKAGAYPVQPIARHLILGNLFGDSPSVLLERVRAEVHLYVAKNKGFVHTASAPYSPRIEEYFRRLRKRRVEVTSANFLTELKLDRCLARSPEPLGRGTYFTTRAKFDELEADLASGILPVSLRGDGAFVEVPRFSGRGIERKKAQVRDFISRQIREILESPDVEIDSKPDRRIHWVFSGPRMLNSYSRFGKHLCDLLASDWTHLLAAVESKKFLEVDWLSTVLRKVEGRRLLLVVPSAQGLDGWRLRRQYAECDPSWYDRFDILSVETPWWRHNRHFFLPLNLRDDGVCELKGGLFFRRKCRANVVSVASFDGGDGRDCSKLLCDFCAYLDEADLDAATARELSSQLEDLVPGILRSRALRQAGLEMVRQSIESRYQRALDRLSRARRRDAPRRSRAAVEGRCQAVGNGESLDCGDEPAVLMAQQAAGDRALDQREVGREQVETEAASRLPTEVAEDLRGR